MLKQIEKSSNFLANNLIKVHICLAIITLLIIFLDQVGYTKYLSNQVIRSLGKQAGSSTFIAAVVAFLYFVLREFYLKRNKAKIKFSQKIESYYRNVMKNTRIIHPVFGTIALYLAIIHGYFIWFRRGTRIDITIEFGMLTLIVLLLLYYMGQRIRLNPSDKKPRVWHRSLAYLFFVAYFCHIFIRDIL